MSSPDRDVRGIKRGLCSECSDCPGYRRNNTDGSRLCVNCNCLPGKHCRADTSRRNGDNQPQVVAQAAVATTLDSVAVPNCQYCSEDAYFDVNTRTQYPCCHFHIPYLESQDQVQDIQDQVQDITFSSIPKASHIHSAGVRPAKDPSLCAIEECFRRRHVDESGKIHECCGFTHAIELSRRQAMESEF